MKPILSTLLTYSRRFLWAVMLAYMLAMHNLYRGEEKTSDTVGTVDEARETPGKSSSR